MTPKSTVCTRLGPYLEEKFRTRKADWGMTTSAALRRALREWWVACEADGFGIRSGRHGRELMLEGGPELWKVAWLMERASSKGSLRHDLGEPVTHERAREAFALVQGMKEHFQDRLAANRSAARRLQAFRLDYRPEGEGLLLGWMVPWPSEDVELSNDQLDVRHAGRIDVEDGSLSALLSYARERNLVLVTGDYAGGGRLVRRAKTNAKSVAFLDPATEFRPRTTFWETLLEWAAPIAKEDTSSKWTRYSPTPTADSWIPAPSDR